MIMKSNFTPYLHQVVPSLLRLINNIFTEKSEEQLKLEQVQREQGEQVDKPEQYNTYDTEEAEVAINMISIIIDEMKEAYVSEK